jgi:hypothetical protein
MKLSMAIKVAQQMCNPDHPATKRSKEVSPSLCMIRVQNGQYLTSQNLERAKQHWSFEEFVKFFGNSITSTTKE